MIVADQYLQRRSSALGLSPLLTCFILRNPPGAHLCLHQVEQDAVAAQRSTASTAAAAAKQAAAEAESERQR